MNTFLFCIMLITGLVNGRNPMAKQHPSGIHPSTKNMVEVPAGVFRPFLKTGTEEREVKVHAFYLDIHAVTNADFLDFVKANPQWAKSKVSPLMADHHYLKQWRGDFEIGDPTIANSPVTNVSWFAAEAYAEWKGKRLPTMQEWEYAAQAGPAGLKDKKELPEIILEWYSRPTPQKLPPVESTFKNKYGLYDMHGLIWEWVYDFNGIITGGDSRGAGALSKNLYCAAGALQAVNKEDYAAFMRFAFRESLKAGYTVRNLGFRCAMDIK